MVYTLTLLWNMRNDVEKYWCNSRLSMILHITDIRKIEIQFHSFVAWSLSENEGSFVALPAFQQTKFVIKNANVKFSRG